MMLRLPIPADLDALALEGELAAAGLPAPVYVQGGDLVLGGLSEDDRPQAQDVMDRHSGTQAAQRVQRESESSNESTIRQRATTALQGNRDFLALASPTNAQAVAQIKALTRQNNGLIRLLLRRFDGTN